MSIVFEAGSCAGQDTERHHPDYATMRGGGTCYPKVTVVDSHVGAVFTALGIAHSETAGISAASEFLRLAEAALEAAGAGTGRGDPHRHYLIDLRSLALYGRDHDHPVTWETW